MALKIIPEFPPNYNQIAAAFNIEDHKNVIFTYGDALYVPAGDHVRIDKPLMKHEERHSAQQREIGVDAWWERFLADPGFRLSQELEAYREQYKAMAAIDPIKRVGYLNHIARDLSSEIYGNLMTFEEAVAVITEGITLNSPGKVKASVNRKAKKAKRQNRKNSRK